MVPAMGTTQKYYAAFARWLARQGFLVVTFDYRGTGQSRTGNLREFKADILDWAGFFRPGFEQSLWREHLLPELGPTR
jgi:predicted alpha/beta hydrolase